MPKPVLDDGPSRKELEKLLRAQDQREIKKPSKIGAASARKQGHGGRMAGLAGVACEKKVGGPSAREVNAERLTATAATGGRNRAGSARRNAAGAQTGKAPCAEKRHQPCEPQALA